MPRISSFYGIVIAMYYREHGAPHFHAFYSGSEASIAIETLTVLRGDLPPRALRLVKQWASIHQDELLRDWNLAERGEVLESIDALP